MDILTKDQIVIEIGTLHITENAEPIYTINGRTYRGMNYQAFQNLDIPDFIETGKYHYDGANFIPYNGYAIHDDTSHQILILLEKLTQELAETKQQLNNVQEKQNEQETILIECFTDLDATINGE